MRQYYVDQPELGDGYVEATKQRSREIMASLSPAAQRLAIIVGKHLEETNGSKKVADPDGGKAPRQET